MYVGASAYEGAVKMYENLVMDCPLYDKMARVMVQLASVYRRLGNYDQAFHYLLYVRGLGRWLVSHWLRWRLDSEV